MDQCSCVFLVFKVRLCAVRAVFPYKVSVGYKEAAQIKFFMVILSIPLNSECRKSKKVW